MSNNDTHQKQAIDSVLKKRPNLDGGAAFSVIAGSGVLRRRPNAGKDVGPYALVGRKQIAQQIVQTEKVKAASTLMGQALIHSVAELSYTMQISFAIAEAIPDEEKREFLVDYVVNGVNYLSVCHAQRLELLRDLLDDLIQQGVEPSLVDRLKAKLNMSE